MAEPKTWAVLTGDVVGSSKLGSKTLQTVMRRLRDGAEQFGEVFEGAVYGKLDVFRGDSWQILIEDRRFSLRAAVFIRACIKGMEEVKADSRVAVAWGAIDSASLNQERVSESTGEAFTASGHALAEMKAPERLAIRPGIVLPPANGRLLTAAVALLDQIVTRWKPGQAQAVEQALLRRTQVEISRRLEVSQPTVNQAMRTAGWKAIELLVTETENIG